ncbi:MAG: LysR family transcriptional regulator [Thermoleophilia bacterium]|nr:LysR family transcriptional regulator [Thermoleophilia bacterium]
MDLRHLLTLRTVVDKGSFSHAADELGISQPAVSFQIRSLEDRMGQRLLDRSGRRVTLTDAGRVVDSYARRILALEDDLLREVGDLSDHLSGPLVLGSSTGPGELLLPRLLGGFKRDNPHAEVRLMVQDTQTVCDRVLDDEIELGVVGAARPHRGLVFEPFVRDELVVICPPDHPLADQRVIALSALAAQPMILQQRGSGVRAVLETAFRAAGVRMRDLDVTLELGLQQSVRAAVLDGLGITVISRLAVERDLAEARLVAVEVEGAVLARDFSLVRHAGRTPSRVSEGFVTYARAQLADHGTVGDGRAVSAEQDDS